MSGNTVAFGWPFPTGSDRVMDGDNAMEALAEAIEDSLSMLRPTSKASSADLTLTTTDALVPSSTQMPVTPKVSEIWVVIFSPYFHATVMGFGDCTCTLYVNGVANTAVQFSPPAVPERLTVTGVSLFAAQGGVATGFELRAKCTLAGGTVKVRASSPWVLMRFPMPTTGALLADRIKAEARPADE